jgi:nucleotide-binding universal stress UspA family protein
MKTILAPVDFSPVCRIVVAAARALARAVEARVVLFHSVPPPPVMAQDGFPLTMPALLLSADVEKSAAPQLRCVQQNLKPRGVRAETICTSGFPVTHILDQARKLAADYIVLLPCRFGQYPAEREARAA